MVTVTSGGFKEVIKFLQGQVQPSPLSIVEWNEELALLFQSFRTDCDYLRGWMFKIFFFFQIQLFQ